jgi:hypothetical protein
LLHVRAKSSGNDLSASDDLSLRNVLQSIATIRHGGQASDGAAKDEDWTSDDLAELLLSSDAAGSALRSIIDIKSKDGRVTMFSIFGVGDFVLEADPELHKTKISELSTGMSATFAMASNGPVAYVGRTSDAVAITDASDPDATATEDPMLAALHWVLRAIASPLGMVLTMLSAFLVVLWLTVRSIASLQQRPRVRRRVSRSRSRLH